MKAPATCSFKPLLSKSFRGLNTLVFAFVVFPEFQSFETRAGQGVGWPSQINSEYSSDVLTYQKPFNWESDFFSKKRAFDVSTGSLSSKEFFVSDRLRIHHELTQDFEFRFTYFRQGDWELDQGGQFVELIYWISQRLGLSTYGQVFRAKANNDVGLALLYKTDEQSESRAYFTSIDFSRNERNSEPDRFTEKPVKYGFVSRHFLDAGFLQVWAHNEPRSKLNDPAQGNDSAQSNLMLSNLGWQAGLFWSPDQTRLWLPRIDVVYDRLNQTESNQEQVKRVQFDQRRLQARLEWEHWFGPHRVRPGLAYFYREYSYSGASTFFRDELPYVWFLFKRSQRTEYTLDQELGLELTRSRGQFALEMTTDRPLERDRLETRLNYRSQFSLGDRGDLAVLLTFDLDEFGSGSTWEGGNVQFRAFF